MKIAAWIRSWFRQVARSGGEQSPPRPRPHAPHATERVFWLGGKPFVAVIDGTSLRDDYVMRLAGRAGLREVALRNGETAEAFANRLLNDLVDAEVRHAILGGLLIPRGEKPESWTPEMAEETAKHLQHLTDPAEKVTLNGLTASFLGDFYARELGSLVNSPIASGTAQGESAPAERQIAMESGAV